MASGSRNGKRENVRKQSFLTVSGRGVRRLAELTCLRQERGRGGKIITSSHHRQNSDVAVFLGGIGDKLLIAR